ncbi:MAG TPA: DUF2490 domain-containing protein [Vicinamibacteria bacterium]|nr:DUF2490 domain-containing protein [Vicinamibacteria bacterium]
MVVGATSRTAAADAHEFWPEASVFVDLNRQTRLYFDGAYASGAESDTQALDLVACVDVSLLPVARPSLWRDDWARRRYLWARVGYTHVGRQESGELKAAENRGVVSLFAKAVLPGDVWLEARARVDLRWIGDEYSTRYRARIEANRDFTLGHVPLTPYFNAEAMYDTRYDGWTRALYQAGSEVTVNKRFRFELFVALQVDRLPSKSTLGAAGAVAKWYF